MSKKKACMQITRKRKKPTYQYMSKCINYKNKIENRPCYNIYE